MDRALTLNPKKSHFRLSNLSRVNFGQTGYWAARSTKQTDGLTDCLPTTLDEDMLPATTILAR
jgi:hypothetical protein